MPEGTGQWHLHKEMAHINTLDSEATYLHRNKEVSVKLKSFTYSAHFYERSKS